jgi:hypothetical protein
MRGFTERIPSEQGGILGWTRICFVIYNSVREFPNPQSEEDLVDGQIFANGSGSGDVSHGEGPANDTQSLLELDEDWPPFDLELDFHWIFGYEGVVLPGGRIMMGQWLDIGDMEDDKHGKGPFIFWDV